MFMLQGNVTFDDHPKLCSLLEHSLGRHKFEVIINIVLFGFLQSHTGYEI